MQKLPFQLSANDKPIYTALGEPPKIINYYDDFDGKTRNAINDGDLQIIFDGKCNKLKFNDWEIELLAKHLILELINHDLSVGTIINYSYGLSKCKLSNIYDLFKLSPYHIANYWDGIRIDTDDNQQLMAIKWVMILLCGQQVGEWSNNFLRNIASLPLNPVDKYRSVRLGTSFITLAQEERIIANIDRVFGQFKLAPSSLTTKELEQVCSVMFSYLWGMRAKQIAMLTTRDVHVFVTDGSLVALHVTFYMLKQRRASSTFALKRRMKLEWAPLVVELLKRSTLAKHNQDRLFSTSSTLETSQIISTTASEWAEDNVNATIFRHSAAQRLVDSGASIEEVADFLGHSYITTSLIYFQSSPNQAQRLNAALGLSPTMQRVLKIAREKYISPEELRELKAEQHIGGMPHGIPIAGIGGCMVGQSLCPKNPILQCYSCSSFMPVLDLALHRQVLKDMRSVANDFAQVSLYAEGSAAYVQLRPMIEGVQGVIREIEGGNYG